MLERATELQDQITAWRRDIHMHPELGFQEHRTARLVAQELRGTGLRVDTGVGKTGVVGHLGEGRPLAGIHDPGGPRSRSQQEPQEACK